MLAESQVRDDRPEPPTPTRRAFPRWDLKILATLVK